MMQVGSIFAMSAPPEGGSAWLQLVPFALVLGIFYFIILLPMKRKQAKVQDFLNNLKVGDRIITTGGLHGQITRLGGESQLTEWVRIDERKALENIVAIFGIR